MAKVNVEGKLTSDYVVQDIIINRGRIHAHVGMMKTACGMSVNLNRMHHDSHSPAIVTCPGCRKELRA